MRHASKLSLTAFGLIIYFSSCSSNSDKENIVLKEVIASLEASNNSINKSSETYRKSLEDQLYDPATNEKAKFWGSKAKKVSDYSNEIFSSIEDLKTQLREKLNSDNSKVFVERILFADKKAQQLIDRLIQYKENLFNVDSNIQLTFEKDINLINDGQDVPSQSSEKIADHFFKNCTLLQSLAILTNFQNAIRIYENRIIMYLHSRPTRYAIHDTFYAPLFSINKSYVKPGDEIEITSGVTSFEWFAETEFIINGEKFTKKGIIKHKLKASQKIGKHLIPIQVSYLDQDGKKIIFEKKLEYEVAYCQNSSFPL